MCVMHWSPVQGLSLLLIQGASLTDSLIGNKWWLRWTHIFITLTHKKCNVGTFFFLWLLSPLLINLSFYNVWKKSISLILIHRKKPAHNSGKWNKNSSRGEHLVDHCLLVQWSNHSHFNDRLFQWKHTVHKHFKALLFGNVAAVLSVLVVVFQFIFGQPHVNENHFLSSFWFLVCGNNNLKIMFVTWQQDYTYLMNWRVNKVCRVEKPTWPDMVWNNAAIL